MGGHASTVFELQDVQTWRIDCLSDLGAMGCTATVSGNLGGGRRPPKAFPKMPSLWGKLVFMEEEMSGPETRQNRSLKLIRQQAKVKLLRRKAWVTC